MRLEDGFVAWAEADPALPAVQAGDDLRSYGRVHQDAAELAGAIGQLVEPGRARVGLFVERGPDAYTAVLATLLAGAAYVPINPSHPPPRIARTIELADLDLIVADQFGLAGLDRLAPTPSHPPVLAPWTTRPGRGRAGADRLVGVEPLSLAPRPAGDDRGDDTAYLLFTSGTTGDPKGVPISHHNVTSFLGHNLDHYRFGPGDRCSQTFDLTFDLSVFDLFMTLGSGACLIPFDGTDLLNPVDLVAGRGLSVWFSVPAVAALQYQRGILRPGAMPSLRTSLFCGEALTVDVARAWVEAAPNSVAENLYGPTELTIACTRHRFAPAGEETAEARAGGVVPIGRPFPDMTAVVLGSDGQPVPAGHEGELCLTGPQRFVGYWRSPARTAERTVTIEGVDHYRTGDRVVDDGDVLHFVGRADDQVQVLGHRVELGEVETAARSIDEVVDAVAVPLPLDEPTTTELGLAVTLTTGSGDDPRTRRRRLRRAISELVPRSMAPSRVVPLDRFPLNANGKIDRRAVANVAFGPDEEEPAAVPSNQPPTRQRPCLGPAR